MHINNAPIIHEETISPRQQLPGPLSARVLPGRSAKALPSDPVLPSRATATSSLPGQVPAPRFNQQLSWHRQPRHSASALSLAAALPICCPSLLPKASRGAREQRRGERLSSCSPEICTRGCEQAGQLGEEPAALLAVPVNRCVVAESLVSPGADVGGDGFPSRGVMGFLAKPSPEPPQGPEQALLQLPGRES